MQCSKTRPWKFKRRNRRTDHLSRAIFLINEITIIPPRHAVGQIIKNVHSDPTQSHFIPAILLFGRRETVSRGRLGVGGFSICLLVGKKEGGGREGEEGGGRNAWKEGSVLLPRRRGKKGEAHTRNGFFSPHPPREIIDSQRGNDVVNTTSVAHPLEPARFFSSTLPPFCYQAPPSCAASSSRNPPLFPPSRLRLCPSCVYNPRSAINSTHPLFFFCANSFLYFIYFSR